MLPTSLVLEIDRLLKASDLSHRQIAERLGVSRGTISAIAQGRRGLYGKDPIDKRRARTPSSAPTRCPACGYRVYLPCLICRARKVQESRLTVMLHEAMSDKPETIR